MAGWPGDERSAAAFYLFNRNKLLPNDNIVAIWLHNPAPMERRIVKISAKLLTVLLTSATAVSFSVEAAPAARAGTQEAARVQPSAQLSRRASDLVRLVNGEAKPEQLFAPSLLAQVPAERLLRIAAAVRTRHGRALGVDRIEAETPDSGRIFLTMENSLIELRIAVDPKPPHLVSGLQL